MKYLLIAAALMLSACESVPDSDSMETGAATPPPAGCVDLRNREGEDAC